MVPDGGRKCMGQIAGFRERLRRVAMTGDGFAGGRAGLGLAVLMVKGSSVLSTEEVGHDRTTSP